MEIECIKPNLAHTHAALFWDKTSAVGWTFNLLSGSSLAAGHLLRLLGMRIHATKASHLTSIGIAGEENYMADVVSHTFQKGKFFTANNNLTSYFQNHSLLPQGHFWAKFTLPTKSMKRVISCTFRFNSKCSLFIFLLGYQQSFNSEKPWVA